MAGCGALCLRQLKDAAAKAAYNNGLGPRWHLLTLPDAQLNVPHLLAGSPVCAEDDVQQLRAQFVLRLPSDASARITELV
jgi:hypothetical protein